MTPEEMRPTRKFAVDAVRFAKQIPRDAINEIAAQLTDAATATASAYRSACRAPSKADFIYKLGNAIEEVDESALWLEIITESGIAARELTAPLWDEADHPSQTNHRSLFTNQKCG